MALILINSGKLLPKQVDELYYILNEKTKNLIKQMDLDELMKYILAINFSWNSNLYAQEMKKLKKKLKKTKREAKYCRHFMDSLVTSLLLRRPTRVLSLFWKIQ